MAFFGGFNDSARALAASLRPVAPAGPGQAALNAALGRPTPQLQPRAKVQAAPPLAPIESEELPSDELVVVDEDTAVSETAYARKLPTAFLAAI